jgi:hypothetical protein
MSCNLYIEHDGCEPRLVAEFETVVSAQRVGAELANEYDAAVDAADGDQSDEALRAVGYDGPNLDGCDVVVRDEDGRGWYYVEEWVEL